MAAPFPFSLPLFLAVVAVLAIAFAGQWVGGLTASLIHNAMALTTSLIALFVANRSAATSDLASRQLLTLAAITAAATMISR